MATKPKSKSAQASSAAYRKSVDARPDTPDFRDCIYVPTLLEVPSEIPLGRYTKLKLPVLDQGFEGACTGFGLAAVANYLLWTRKVRPQKQQTSPRMLYEMARRYDEWEGEDYEGSSARGAMKGWHKHGVCTATDWPYNSQQPDKGLTQKRAKAASERVLGAYYRVNHKDLVAMHTAMAEVGILYVTAITHAGWDEVNTKTGKLPYDPDKHAPSGGHAFVIVAYDQSGFWIQNSWSKRWGRGGFAQISYDDWLAHGTDVWVARLGVSVTLTSASARASTRSAAAGSHESLSQAELRPHIVSFGNDGRLRDRGMFATPAKVVAEIIGTDMPRIMQNWKRKRVLLYAHGGLVSEKAAVQRLAEYRATMLDAEVYPISLIWKTDYWTTITNILKDAFSRRRSEGILDASKDFMLDRLDDTLEPVARALTGKAVWDEMKENAVRASTREDGGARLLAELLAELAANNKIELHAVGHSAGAIFLAPLLQRLATKGTITEGNLKGMEGFGLPLATTTLWAPACTTELFRSSYLPLINAGQINRFSLYTLTDFAEQGDHCARLYNKSLLYLVSNAFEDKPRIPLIRPNGVPILGMEKAILGDRTISNLFKDGTHDWVVAPNAGDLGDLGASRASHHGDFDDDEHTVRATLGRILGVTAARKAPVEFQRSAASFRDKRESIG